MHSSSSVKVSGNTDLIQMQISLKWPTCRRAEIWAKILLLGHAQGAAPELILVGLQERTTLAALRPDVDLLSHRTIRLDGGLYDICLRLNCAL